MPAGNRGPRSYRALLALAAVGCAALLGAGSPAAHASGATTTLSNDVVHNLSYATLTGSVPATQTVTVGVFLSNPNQAAEDAYVKQLYDPSSPNYGNYLDPDTFNSQFGVPAATTQAAQSWLQGAGLTVTPIEGATNYVLASGSAAQVEAAFGTPINNYTANGRSFYANTLAPTVPAVARDLQRLRAEQLQQALDPARAGDRPVDDDHAGRDERERPEDGAAQHPGPLVDLRRALDEPGQRPVDGDLRLGRHRSRDPRPALLRGRVGPPGRADLRQEVRRHVDARHERRRRDRRVGARHAGVDGHGAQRHVGDPLLRAPQHRRRHPRFDGRLGERQARARCRAAPRTASARTSATRTRSSPTAWRCPGTRSSSRPPSRVARSSRPPATPARPARHRLPVSAHERRRDAALSRPQWPSASPWAVAVGGTVPARRRQHAGEAPRRDGLGVHRRRQLDERAGRQLPDRRRARRTARSTRTATRTCRSPARPARSAARRRTSPRSRATSPPATAC